MTHPDYRALALEMADELDHNRRCLMDDRTLTHPLADRARAALAAEPKRGIQLTPPPDLLRNAVSEWSALPLAEREASSLADHVATAAYRAGARAALAAEPGEGASLSSLVRYGVTWDGRKTTPLLTPMPDGYWTPWHIAVECTHPAPVPVAERPWDRNGWCTDNGHCWLWDAFASRWIHRHHTASRLIEVDFTLPHWALPLPEAQP